MPQITFLWLSLTYNPRRIGLILRLTSNGGSVSDPLFGAMRQSVIDGAPDKAAELAQQALDSGVDPLEAVNHGFAAGITFAGDQFGCGQMFLPDLLASAEAMQAAMKILEPEMLKRGSERETLGKVVLGTARGDIHDIGKNLVATILSASGFQIFDLGTSVTPSNSSPRPGRSMPTLSASPPC